MKDKNNLGFAFTKQNYILLISGIILIGLGLFLMIAPPEDPNKLLVGDNVKIFDTQRLIIAPILIATGFIVEVFAIMHKANKE